MRHSSTVLTLNFISSRKSGPSMSGTVRTLTETTSIYDSLLREGRFAELLAALRDSGLPPEPFSALCQRLAREARANGYPLQSNDIVAEYGKAAERLMQQWPRPANVILGPAYLFQRIGHMATGLGGIVRLKQLGLFPDLNFILFPSQGLGNPAYLELWRRYFDIQPDVPSLIGRYGSTLCQMTTAWLPGPAGRWLQGGDAYQLAEITVKDRRPLLALSDAEQERGWKTLQQLGVPSSAWFVCLHARSPAYLAHQDDAHNRHRNSDILSFEGAVRRIAERGGYVVRIGDANTVHLPNWPNTIDLPHRMAWTEWMDVFLLGGCRFFLGDSSGPTMVVASFGRPAVCVNVELGGTLTPTFATLLPKLFRERRTGRIIPLPEAARSRLLFCVNANVLDELGVDVVDNTPDEIEAATIEMMDMLDGKIVEDADLQRRYKASFPMMPVPVAPTSPAFLRKHATLLG
jgi:putative glycosyltransferase (TIGR04372 family)